MSADAAKEEAIFDAAIQMEDPAARSTFLDDACGGDTTLRAAVEELLAFHDTKDDLLANPVVELNRPPDMAVDELPGTVLDRYRIGERIGEGAFGEVYRAEQLEPVRRDVALKILKPGMDSREVIARFDAERQALAMMSHPHIAMVLDAGSTPAGRPFFVMELVAGRPIDEYCDAERMDVRERLGLFATVCRAVQHAHQKGIVHRDLKPSNVLVMRDDTAAPAVPKVIDFGVAKAIKQSPGDDLARTGLRMLVGTPEYMSPEQISGAADIDTRADIYGLGGMLYKLLTGVTPLEHERANESSFEEICRTIRDVDPMPPSARVVQPGDCLRSRRERAIFRGAKDDHELARMLRGDLDWIVMKALEKDRVRRYETASELARDIERHLDSQPVSAGPPSRWYVVSKFVRRNRVAVTAATLVAVALIVGGALAAAGFVRAQRERQHAQREWQRAEHERSSAEHAREQAVEAGQQAQQARETAENQRQIAEAAADKAQRVAGLLEQLVGASHPEHGHPADYTVRQLLDDFAESLAQQLEGQPEIESSVRRTIGRSYLRIGDLTRAGPQLERALELRRRVFGDDDARTAQSGVDYAMYLVLVPRLDEAERVAQAAIDTLAVVQASPRANSDQEPAGRRLYGGDLAWAYHVLASVRFEFGDFAEAERLRREAWSLAERALGRDHSDAILLQARAAGAMMRNNRDTAEQLARDALERLRALRPADHADVGQAEMNLAWVLFARGQLDEAEQLVRQAIATFRKSLGAGSSYEAACLTGLAEVLTKQNRPDDAESTAREAVRIAEQVTIEGATLRGRAYRSLAIALERSKPAEAADAWAKAIEIRRQIVGNRPEVAQFHRRRAALLQQLGRFDDAVECFREVLAIARARTDSRVPSIIAHTQLADALHEAERPAEAETVLRQAISGHGEAAPELPLLRFALVEVLIDQKKLDEADAEVRELERIGERESRTVFRAMTQTARGKLLVAQRDFDAAERQLRETLQLVRWNQNPQVRLHTLTVLGQCLIETDRLSEAEQHLLRVEQVSRRYSVRPEDARRLLKQLVELYTRWNKPDDADRWRRQLQQTQPSADDQ